MKMFLNSARIKLAVTAVALAFSPCVWADAFTPKHKESNHNEISVLAEQIRALQERLDAYERASVKEMDTLQNIHAASSVYGGASPKLTFEQKYALRNELKSRYEVLGKVNGRHIVRQGSEISILNDVEFQRLEAEEETLIIRALVGTNQNELIEQNFQLPGLAEYDSQPPATTVGEIQKRQEEQKKEALLTAKQRLEARRQANAQKSQSDSGSSRGAYRAQTISSYGSNSSSR